jgi:hypothetical protein
VAVDQPLLVLLLPRRLEAFHLEQHVRDLLRAPGVVAVDPARIPLARMAPLVAARAAVGQARRMKLPGRPAAVAVFHPNQFFLAGAMLSRHQGAELWYGRPEDGELDPQLDDATQERAVMTMPPEELLLMAPLRMAELGIVSDPRSGPGA